MNLIQVYFLLFFFCSEIYDHFPKIQILEIFIFIHLIHLFFSFSIFLTKLFNFETFVVVVVIEEYSSSFLAYCNSIAFCFQIFPNFSNSNELNEQIKDSFVLLMFVCLTNKKQTNDRKTCFFQCKTKQILNQHFFFFFFS